MILASTMPLLFAATSAMVAVLSIALAGTRVLASSGDQQPVGHAPEDAHTQLRSGMRRVFYASAACSLLLAVVEFAIYKAGWSDGRAIAIFLIGSFLPMMLWIPLIPLFKQVDEQASPPTD